MSGAVDSKQSNAAAAALVSPSCPPKSILPPFNVRLSMLLRLMVCLLADLCGD